MKKVSFHPPCMVQEKRLQLFNDYMKNGQDYSQVEAIFKQRLTESQKTTLRYGFRNDVWIQKHHGDRKAAKLMQRKKDLGLILNWKLFKYLQMLLLGFSNP